MLSDSSSSAFLVIRRKSVGESSENSDWKQIVVCYESAWGERLVAHVIINVYRTEELA